MILEQIYASPVGSAVSTPLATSTAPSNRDTNMLTLTKEATEGKDMMGKRKS